MLQLKNIMLHAAIFLAIASGNIVSLDAKFKEPSQILAQVPTVTPTPRVYLVPEGWSGGIASIRGDQYATYMVNMSRTHQVPDGVDLSVIDTNSATIYIFPIEPKKRPRTIFLVPQGWNGLTATIHGNVYEIQMQYILQRYRVPDNVNLSAVEVGSQDFYVIPVVPKQKI